MKFRKKPVVIDAFQYNGDDGKSEAAKQLCYCRQIGKPTLPMPHIHTMEGVMHVSVGDWIITGIKGEQYPCKPDIFEATYERAE